MVRANITVGLVFARDEVAVASAPIINRKKKRTLALTSLVSLDICSQVHKEMLAC